MEKLNITPGRWRLKSANDSLIIYSDQHGAIAEIHHKGKAVSEHTANATLLTEAGTVANETGLTPRQLLEQRNELLEALIEMCDYFNFMIKDPKFPTYQKAIAIIQAHNRIKK